MQDNSNNNPDLPNLVCSGDTIFWPRDLPSGAVIQIEIHDLRREKTGMHGLVAVTLPVKGTVLAQPIAHDTFNLGRSAPRQQLAKRAHPELGLINQEYMLESLNHDIDTLCLWASRKWEASRFEIERVDPNETISPLRMALKPYVIDGGGTIMFGSPGSGKSYVALMMAVCLANGLMNPWESEPSPVLYVNLERSRRSVVHRDMQLRDVFGISDTGIDYLHGAGQSYQQVHPTVKSYVDKHPGTVVILDSISRAGLGKLIEDVTANAFIDKMISLGTSWIGIGHTPKHNSETLFGSMHFEAGQDVGIKISSDLKGSTRGVALQVVKANDIMIPPVQYIALEFGADGLSGFRATNTREFPALSGETKAMTDHETIMALLSDGAMNMKEIARACGKTQAIIRTTISRHPSDYVKLSGAPTKWGLATQHNSNFQN